MKWKKNTIPVEEWDRNSRTRYTDKDKAMKVLSETLWEIASIRQILQEAQKEEQKKMKTDKKIPSCQNCAYYRAFYNEGIWDFGNRKQDFAQNAKKSSEKKKRANRGVLIKKSRRRNRLLTKRRKISESFKKFTKSSKFPPRRGIEKALRRKRFTASERSTFPFGRSEAFFSGAFREKRKSIWRFSAYRW